jgi:outer membrane murein-binding lipoprotein Lpp
MEQEETAAGAGAPGTERVAAVLEQLRSGVRQRTAEVAAVGAGADAARHRLVELASREYVEEPLPVSPRPVLGRLLVFSRKAVFHLFLKWFTRPVLEQQNGFNESASRLIQDLVKQQEGLERQVRRLAAQVEKLAAERSGAPPPPPA